MRGQIFDLYHGRDQKSAVVDQKDMVVGASIFRPANPCVPHRHASCASTVAQPANPSEALTMRQVSELCPAKRSAFQIMVRVQQTAPKRGQGACTHTHDLHIAKLGKRTRNRCNWRWGHGPAHLSKRIMLGDFRKPDCSHPVQFEQGLATTHFLGTFGLVVPLHPFAHPQRQLAPRNTGLGLYGLGDPGKNIVRKCFPAHRYHAQDIHNKNPCVQKKMWVIARPNGGEGIIGSTL